MQPNFSGSGQNASGTINQSSPYGPGGVQAIYNAVQPAVQGAVGNLWSGHPIGQLLGVNTAYASGSTNPTTQGVNGASTGPGPISPTGGFTPVPPGGNNGGGSNPPPSNNGGSSLEQQFHNMYGQNAYMPPGWNPPGQAQQDAAQQAYNAENGRLNTQFDQSAADLNAQLPYLQQQRDSALSSLGLANDSAVNQANSARLSAQTNTTDQINQAGDVAHQTQNQNRNILRALGIGGGTYAAELLSKPLNTYDQQRGQLNQALQQRSQQLDDYLNTVTQQHSQAVSDLQNNYANLVGKIQSDLRFNDRQRNDAISAANAALQTNLANIQSSAQQYAQQVQLMKMQLAQSAGTVTNYANPTYDPTAFQNQLLSNGQSGFGNGSQTGNLQALTQKKQGTGLIYDQQGNPIGSSANGNQMISTLSGLGQ